MFFNKSEAYRQNFEMLLVPYLERLYRTAFRLTCIEADAEDLVQDVILKLFPKYDELLQVNDLGPWLDKVMYRQFVDKLRKNKSTPLDYVEDIEDTAINHGTLGRVTPLWFCPDKRFEQKQLIEALERALENLGTNQRLIVVLFEIEGYSAQEINEITGFPVSTIKTWLRRSRERLRDMLKNEITLYESCELKKG